MNRKGKNNFNFGNKWTDKQKKRQSILTKKAMNKPEIRKQMRDNHANVSGQNNPMFDVHRFGKNAPCYGKIRLDMRGKSHFNYQGGKSLEIYPSDWHNINFRESIRERDHHKCQLCGVPEIECNRKLDVHHIDYDKQNVNPSNLISLCKSCHTKTNFNRESWEKYFHG